MAVIGSLGTVIFEVSNKTQFSGMGLGILGNYLNKKTGNNGITFKTPNNFKRSSEARWAVHEIIGQKPVSEFIGPGLEKFSFEMILDANLGVDPTEELEKLRTMRDTGEKVFLILGDSPVLDNNSRVYITNLDEDVARVDSNGNIIAINVSISLKEYALRREEMAIENNTSQSS